MVCTLVFFFACLVSLSVYLFVVGFVGVCLFFNRVSRLLREGFQCFYRVRVLGITMAIEGGVYKGKRVQILGMVRDLLVSGLSGVYVA